MKKIITIIGARPQFIKASVVSREIQKRSNLEEIIIHTGQHFDENMSKVFFDQLDLPRPRYQLNIHGGNHGAMTGRMLAEIENVLVQETPDYVMVYGDTNSTLAGALAAAKLHIPVIHIEAGLRSFNMQMPEEINRILTDRISSILFCPTQAAVNNLDAEGFFQRESPLVFNVGDVMQDSALFFSKQAVKPKKLKNDSLYILTTIHRADNTDNPKNLTSIVNALNFIHSHIAPVILPLHPRTQATITNLGLKLQVEVIDPVGYLEMLWLLKNTDLVLTDSGGVQKEAYFFGKACVTMREQTEWIELIEANANELVGSDTDKIISSVKRNLSRKIKDEGMIYGGGNAAKKIIDILQSEAVTTL